jgi:hypothetical protein
MSGSFKMLCEQLSQKLVPALAAAGYSGPARFHRREIRYDFKRQSIDGTHVVSILFDKYRNPDFAVQVYLEPPEGLSSLVARGGQLMVGDVAPTRRMWPFGLPLFRAERPKWQRLFGKTASAEAAVERCIALIPEIEGWWVNQRSSRHILTGRVVYRGSAVSA